LRRDAEGREELTTPHQQKELNPTIKHPDLTITNYKLNYEAQNKVTKPDSSEHEVKRIAGLQIRWNTSHRLSNKIKK
jgi:hypothetical protein